MKIKVNKLLALLMVLMMVFDMVPVSAMAEDGGLAEVVTDNGESVTVVEKESKPLQLFTSPDELQQPEEETVLTEQLTLTGEQVSVSPESAESFLSLIQNYDGSSALGQQEIGLRSTKKLSAKKNAAPLSQQFTGYAAFDIKLNESVEQTTGGYVVPVSLQDGIQMLDQIEKVDGKTVQVNDISYVLYHIKKDENGNDYVSETILPEANAEDGVLNGFTFTTFDFSDFVLKYTVDFTYINNKGEEHAISFGGRDTYALVDILTDLGVQFNRISNAELLLVRQVGEIDDTALYLTYDEESGYILHSDTAFNDIYSLTVITDTDKHVIMVQDAASAEITVKFVDASGADITSPTLTSDMYVVVPSGNNSIAPQELTATQPTYTFTATQDWETITGAKIYLLHEKTNPGWRDEIPEGGVVDGQYVVSYTGNTIILSVPPENTTQITYYEIDGTTIDTDPTGNSGYHILAYSGNSKKYYATFNSDGTLNWYDNNNQLVTGLSGVTNFELRKYNGTLDFGTADQGTTVSGTELYEFELTSTADENNVFQFTATKKLAYDVEIKTSDGKPITGADGYSMIVSKKAEGTWNGNTQEWLYYRQENNLPLNGKASLPYSYSSFNAMDSNINPNTCSYAEKDDISVVLGKNLSIGNNDSNRGQIIGDIVVKDGDLIGDYTVNYKKEENKTVVTLTKNEPYEYSIKSASNGNVTLDAGFTGKWYLMTTLTKNDGTKYYHVAEVPSDGTGITKVETTIEKFYQFDDNTTISSPSGASTVYQPTDTVEHALVYTGTNEATKYKEIINGFDDKTKQRDVYDNTDIVNKYSLSCSSSNGTGNIIFENLPPFKLNTTFVETDNTATPEGDIPSDYKLLIEMIRDGKTYYALNDVPANESAVTFYEYIKGTNGGSDSIGTTPYYYSGNGNEVLTTQVVTGATSLTADLVNHKVNGAVFYNENTVDDETQESDLTKDLFSTSSTVAKTADANVMTTTFKRQKNDGVDHEIEVNFFTEKVAYPGDASKKVENAELETTPGAYYFVVRLYNEGKLVAYTVKAAENVSAANDGGTFTTTIRADDTFTIVDDKGIDIAGSNKVKYDPTVYTSKVRLYKANTANDLPTKLSEAGDKGADVLPGYDFLYNKDWTDDVDLKTEVDGVITKTGTRLGLYGAKPKVYQVKVIVEDGTELAEADNIDLYVQAIHKTTNIDYYGDEENKRDILSNATKTTEGGKTVYTIVIEDQRNAIQKWTDKGDENNRITGNESFKLYVTQKENELANNAPITLANGKIEEGKKVDYKVTYDAETTDENGIFLEKNVTTDSDVTTITHYVTISKAKYDPAIGPYDVLGEGAEFGVVADTYERKDHAETNFAVHHYIENTAAGFDLAANGDHAMPFYAGTYDHFKFTQNTTVNPDIYVPSDRDDLYVHTASDEATDHIHQDSYAYQVTVIPTKQSTVDRYVNGLIDKLTTSSETLSKKEAMLKPTGKAVDTTMFPDNITIYVDASDMNLSEAGWTISKLQGQSIVFNIPGSYVHLAKEVVNVYTKDDSGNLQTVVENLDSNTGGNGGDAAHNSDVENLILNHIVFNAYEASKVDFTDGPAGLFLAPHAHVEEINGSGTGWVATGNKFTQTGAEWHFFRTQRKYTRDNVVAGFKAAKKIQIGETVSEPTEEQKFTFVMQHLDWSTGNWITDDGFTQQNNKSVINFPVIEYDLRHEGVHYYRISETVNASDEYTHDNRVYYVKVTVAVSKVSGTRSKGAGETGITDSKQLNGYKMAEPEYEYYVYDPNGNTANPEGCIERIPQTIHDRDTVTVNGQDYLEPYNVEVTVVDRYGIKVDELTAATDTYKNAPSTKDSESSDVIVFINSKALGTITLTKTGKNNAALAGAKFDLYRVKTGDETADVKTNTEDLVTNAEGKITVDNLEPGTYYFVETAAPAGYVTPTGEAAKTATREVAAGQATLEPLTVSMTNTEEAKGTITLTKTGKNNAALAGAKFDLYRVKTGEEAADVKINTEDLVTNAEGKITVDNLEPGTYYFVETAAPAGYVMPTGDAAKTETKVVEAGKATLEPLAVSMTNTYEADGSATLKGTKKIVGREFQEGDEWTFVVSAQPADAPMPDKIDKNSHGITVKPVKGNSVELDFGEIKFTLDDLKGNSSANFQYRIVEEGRIKHVKNDVEKIVHVALKDLGDGKLEATVQESAAELVFTNTYDKGDLAVEKTVENGLDPDKEFAFTVTLSDKEISGTYGEMTFEKGVASFTLKDGEKKTATGLPALITYKVEEEAYDGYFTQSANAESVIDKDNCKTATFTNTYSADGEVVLSAKKTLNGRELKADEFTFELKAEDGTLLQTKKNAADGSVVFDKIKYTVADAAKSPITYTISEVKGTDESITYDEHIVTAKVTITDNGDGTLATAVDEAGSSAAFINTYGAKGEVILSAHKVLNGRELKADEFSFELKDADGNVLQTKKNAADGAVVFDAIAYKLEDVAKSPLIYTISEVKGTDKSVIYDEHVEKITVTLTDEGDGTVTAKADKTGTSVQFTNDTYGVKVSKVDVADGKELEGATIQILDKDGKVVEEWTSGKEAHEVRGLLTGEEYTLKETVAPEGYCLTAETHFTIDEDGKVTSGDTKISEESILLIEDDRTRIKVQKTDAGTGEELTGATIQILDKDGNVVEEWVSDKDKPHEITLLHVNEEYTLRETVAPEGYLLTTDITFTIDETGKVTTSGSTTTDENGEVVLLVEDWPEITSVSVSKVWKDDNNRDGRRPMNLTVKLYANGTEIATRQLTAANGWAYVEKNLRKCDAEGKEIAYTWEEVPAGNGYTAEAKKVVGSMTVFTNGYTCEETEISVRKVWNDNDNANGTRPASIRVQLLADGEVVEEATLDAGNGWKTTWTGLKKNVNTTGMMDGSKAIKYTVEETDIPEGYVCTITGDGEKGFVITNSNENGKLVIKKIFDIEEKEPEPETMDALISIPVVKIWDDMDNVDGNRPDHITVHLFEGGEEIASAILNEANGWKHTFEDLPQYRNNLTIRYHITEDPVEHYTTMINGYTIVNKYNRKMTSVTVRKVWEDFNDKKHERPASLKVTLNNGMSVTLNNANGWTATISNLPVIVNGEEMEYFWHEAEVAGYKQLGVTQTGTVTTFTNRIIGIPEVPPDQPKPRTFGPPVYIFEEYDTALGIPLLINHVGDCFD